MSELYLAKRYLFRGKAKHVSFIGVISCVGIILGVATVIVAISILNGIDGGLMERIMRFQYHLTVESVVEDGHLDEVKKTVKEWEEIESVSLSIQTQVFAKFEETIVPLIVKGIDFDENQEKDFFYQYVKEDSKTDGFFVGEGLRRRFYLDDQIEFYPLKKKLSLQKENVRGSFRVGLYDIDNYCIITDLDRARELSPHYQFFLGVRIKEPFNAGELKKKILNEFPEGIFVSTWIDTNEALFATLKLEKIAMFIILTLIISIASFNIFATLTVKVVEKTKDIGILKSVGFTGKKILFIFTLQGVILGIIGVVGGSLLGTGICYILKQYPFIRLPEEIFFTEYLPVVVNYGDVFWIAVLTIFISFVSSLIPAFKAGRLSACEALRYE